MSLLEIKGKDDHMQTFFNLAGESLGRVLEQFMLNSFDSIVITTADIDDHQIVYANPVFCRMTGYAFEELIGKKPSMLAGEKTNPRIIENLKSCLATNKPFRGATTNYRKDGTPYFVEWNIQYIFDQNGKPLFYISIQKDLTNLRYIMSKLKHRSSAFKQFLSDLINKTDDSHINQVLDTVKNEETASLQDEFGLFSEALREDEKTELFDDEFFDFTPGEKGVLTESVAAKPKISALEYAKTDDFKKLDANVLAHSIQDLLNACDLQNVQSDKCDINDIVNELKSVADSIFYTEEFTEIGTVISELTLKLTMSEDATDDMIISSLTALAEDLDTWCNAVFKDISAEDIHFLDASLIGSAKQVLAFL